MKPMTTFHSRHHARHKPGQLRRRSIYLLGLATVRIRSGSRFNAITTAPSPLDLSVMPSGFGGTVERLDFPNPYLFLKLSFAATDGSVGGFSPVTKPPKLCLIRWPPLVLVVEFPKLGLKSLQTTLLQLAMAGLRKGGVLAVKLRVRGAKEGEPPRATAGCNRKKFPIFGDD